MKKSDLFFMAFLAGLNVANLYYNQPLLEVIRETFGSSTSDVGLVSPLTQMGYAMGMLLFVPMGDLFERVKLMKIFNVIAALSLFAVALSPNLVFLCFASFILGLSTMVPQILIPYVAGRAGESGRGQAVGAIVSGILLGILLARTIAGFLGAALGWRGMFAAAGCVILPMTFLIGLKLPPSVPHFTGTYRSLMKSLWEIFRTQKLLREAALVGGCLFGAFSAFWSTLIFLMSAPPFNLGMKAVGLFGLLGAVGALGASFAGKMTDRLKPRIVVGVGIGVAFISFLVLDIFSTSLVGLAIGVVLMDLGVQGAHVANQSRVFAINPKAQSRLNTVYMFSYFIGGAAGSVLSALAWKLWCWNGVCGLALALLAVGILRLLTTQKTHSGTLTNKIG